MFTATIPSKRCRGWPFHAIRDAFVDGLRLLILEISDRINAHEWIGYAKCENDWN